MYFKLVVLLLGVAVDAACPAGPAASSQFKTASGWAAQVVANGLKSPRGMIFDKLGQLIVVEQSKGLRVLKLADNGKACVLASKSTVLLSDSSLNHGIELSPDGTTLYASSSDQVYSWTYDASALTLSNKKTIIMGMANADHVTRTLLLSKAKPNMMLVSRGSNDNLDFGTVDESSGRSMIKSFDISTGNTYNYNTDGVVVGWGLRNEVGISEHPSTSGIWAVENSADNIQYVGKDIHNTNPGEKLNFLGYMNGAQSSNFGSNFGYPLCFATYDPSVFPAVRGPYVLPPTVGQQFAQNPNSTYSDIFCKNSRTAPRLVFEAHTAPLDIKFDSAGNNAWISFHGSWNRQPPAGYKLSYVKFANGQPVEPSTSTTSLTDILTNADNTKCPGSCFRPAGLAIDGSGRVFMSSDATGEVWVISTA